MKLIFGIVFIFLVFATLLASLFIVFHIKRYALNQRLGFLMMLLFLVTTIVLLGSDTYLFFSLPIDSLTPDASSGQTFP